MRVALVTVSDSVTQGIRPDRSGPELRERCLARGWQVVCTVATPDEPSVLQARLIGVGDSGAAGLILTCGGLGVDARGIYSGAKPGHWPWCLRVLARVM